MTQIKQNQKKKNIDPSGLVKKTDYNAKITEIEGKIPSISGLAALTAVGNEITDVSTLIKKINYDTKISELEEKLIIIMTNILLLQV